MLVLSQSQSAQQQQRLSQLARQRSTPEARRRDGCVQASGRNTEPALSTSARARLPELQPAKAKERANGCKREPSRTPPRRRPQSGRHACAAQHLDLLPTWNCSTSGFSPHRATARPTRLSAYDPGPRSVAASKKTPAVKTPAVNGLRRRRCCEDPG